MALREEAVEEMLNELWRKYSDKNRYFTDLPEAIINSKAIRFQKWSLIAVFLHLLTVFYSLSDSSNAEYLLWNGNRVQIKKDLNDL